MCFKKSLFSIYILTNKTPYEDFYLNTKIMYEEVKARYIIDYTPGEETSMRLALAKYAELIESGNGFRSDYCVVQFAPSEPILPSYFKQDEVLIKQLKNRCSDFDSPELNDLSKEMLTEDLFFLCAAMSPNLETDLKATAEAMVRFARKENDSSKMWITCEEPFGLTPLYIIASKYPKYGYLLASFMVPYWDDEHMPESLHTVAEWAEEHGVTPDTIKALCYCDNQMALSLLLGYDIFWSSDVSLNKEIRFNLLQTFRENPETYTLFKTLLAERYASEPYLQYSSDAREYITNPIGTLVAHIVVTDGIIEEEDGFSLVPYLEKTFVEKSAKEEIKEIIAFVEQQNGAPIVPSHQEYKKWRKLLKQKSANALKNEWKEMFLTLHDNGEILWAYVNGDSEELNKEEIEKIDLFTMLEESSLALFSTLNSHHIDDDNDELYEYFDRVINELCKAFFVNQANKQISSSDGQFVLRLLDVLFAWSGDAPFASDIEKEVVNKFKLISSKDYSDRYTPNWFADFHANFVEFANYYSCATKEELENCYNQIQQNRNSASECIPPIFTKVGITYLSQDKKAKTIEYNGFHFKPSLRSSGFFTLAAYLLKRERYNEGDNELTRVCTEFINKNLINKTLENLFSETTCSSLRYKKVDANTTPEEHIELEKRKEQRDLLITYVNDGRITQEREMFSEEQSYQAALATLRNILKYDEEESISEKQPKIEWLEEERCNQKLLLAVHMVAQLDHVSCTDACKRMMRLVLEVAPVKVCRFLDKLYKEDAFGSADLKTIKAFVVIMEKQGLSKDGKYAYVLEELVNAREDEEINYFKSLLSEYCGATAELEGFLGDLQAKERTRILEAVKLMSYSKQFSLLENAGELLPEIDLSSRFDDQLIARIGRLMDKPEVNKTSVVRQFPEYLAGLLALDQVSFEHLNFRDWDESTHKRMEEIVHAVDFGKEVPLNPITCLNELNEVRVDRLVIVHKKRNHYYPIWGEEAILTLRNGIRSHGIYNSAFHLIVLPEDCPQNYIDFTKKLVCEDFGHYCKKQVQHYLRTGENAKVAEQIARYAINDREWKYELSVDYSDTEIEEFLLSASEQVRTHMLRFLAWISPECLDMDLDIDRNKRCELYIASELDTKNLFLYFSSLRGHVLLERYSKAVDITTILDEVKADQHCRAMSLIAHQPRYYNYVIETSRSHSDEKIQNHAKELVEKMDLEAKLACERSNYEVVDYGRYIMEGDTTPEEGSNNKKTAQEPKCKRKTTVLTGELDMYFGCRFTAKKGANVPKVFDHKVRVTHPTLNEAGEVVTNICEWNQNGYSESKIFLGWYIENEAENIPGVYRFEVFDTEGTIIVRQEIKLK